MWKHEAVSLCKWRRNKEGRNYGRLLRQNQTDPWCKKVEQPSSCGRGYAWQASKRMALGNPLWHRGGGSPVRRMPCWRLLHGRGKHILSYGQSGSPRTSNVCWGSLRRILHLRNAYARSHLSSIGGCNKSSKGKKSCRWKTCCSFWNSPNAPSLVSNAG